MQLFTGKLYQALEGSMSELLKIQVGSHWFLVANRITALQLSPPPASLSVNNPPDA